jgi:ribosome-associated heat shock protein Hsp15
LNDGRSKFGVAITERFTFNLQLSTLNPEPRSLRLDKWLWAARFFKTRQHAQDAVTGGKVELNGQRTKPAHPLRVGDRLRIRQGPYLAEVVVQDLTERRGSAATARTLYAETEASLAERARLHDMQEHRGVAPRFDAGRPRARDRRSLRRLRRLER